MGVRVDPPATCARRSRGGLERSIAHDAVEAASERSALFTLETVKVYSAPFVKYSRSTTDVRPEGTKEVIVQVVRHAIWGLGFRV